MVEMFGVTAGLLLVFAQSQAKAATPVDRSGEQDLVRLLEKYGKLPPFYCWIDRYSGDGESQGYDKGGTARLWFGGGKRFRVYTAGSFGDGIMAVSDGKTLMFDPLDLSSTVELEDMPTTWQKMPDQLAPNQNGFVLMWLLDGKASLDTLAEKDKPITVAHSGKTLVVSFTNKTVGQVNLEITDGWLTADELVQSFESDGQKFVFKTRNVYQTLDFSQRFPNGLFDTKPAKGVVVEDTRKKHGHAGLQAP